VHRKEMKAKLASLLRALAHRAPKGGKRRAA
jgi:hypothetical protein